MKSSWLHTSRSAPSPPKGAKYSQTDLPSQLPLDVLIMEASAWRGLIGISVDRNVSTQDRRLRIWRGRVGSGWMLVGCRSSIPCDKRLQGLRYGENIQAKKVSFQGKPKNSFRYFRNPFRSRPTSHAYPTNKRLQTHSQTRCLPKKSPPSLSLVPPTSLSFYPLSSLTENIL